MPGLRALLTIPICLALASCATLERDEVVAPADGGSVTMRVGAPLVISLAADPATGYGWVVKSSPPNLELVGGPDYTPQPRPPGLAGVAGTTAFRFRATAIGSGPIEFAWTAPPGAPPQPARALRYDVTVGPGMWVPTEYLGTIGLPSVRAPGRYGNPSEASPTSDGAGAVK